MRHQAFVNALAECDEDGPQWHALCAGFLVLRHFDEWLTEESLSASEDLLAVGRVREQINAVPESEREARYLLDVAVDMFGQAEPTDVVGAIGPLLAYGTYLEQSGQQLLGRHVLSVVSEVLAWRMMATIGLN